MPCAGSGYGASYDVGVTIVLSLCSFRLVDCSPFERQTNLCVRENRSYSNFIQHFVSATHAMAVTFLCDENLVFWYVRERSAVSQSDGEN